MIDRRRLLMTAAAAGAGLAASGQALARALPGADPVAELNGWMDRVFQDLVMTSPEILTSLGLDKGALAPARSQLDDRSQAKIEADKAKFNRFADELNAIDRSALTGRDAVNYDTVKFFGETVQIGQDFPYGTGNSPYTVYQLGGAYQNIPDFLDSQHQIETAEDAEAYLARLAAFPTALDQETERMLADFAAGAVPPDFVIDKTLLQLANLHDTPAAESIMTTSVERRTSEKGIAGDWAARAERIVAGEIYPALLRQADAFKARRAGAVHDAGVWRLPDGEAWYSYGLRNSTTTTITGEEVHQMGLEQVAELTARADALLRAEGMTQGTVGQRIAAMSQDQRFIYPNTDAGKEQLLADLNLQMQDMQARLPDYFGRIPKSPVEVRRVPVFTEAGAPGGYYQGPALDGSRPGAYYINLRDTAEWPKWTLPTLTYHEASPGHHHQIALQQENDDAPMLLKILGFSAYSEGWGLYAEQLADEMGVYADDPWGQIGYLQSLMFRATRLVVDSGLHHKRWSREQAIRYMVDTLGDQESAVTTEVERYAVWPGQASSYKIGHTEWVRLRENAKAALGDRFDIKGFHDTGLAVGGVPLTVLEEVITDWVAARKA
ncbi:DUF885 family protein [Brevundimonas sp. A19_0]|uniref:DUF885 domain-containing protein n=1 Tax=Brevundimonas sp. A19_0 TaxID=2821087 RepID=UPI001ADB5B45|nr:DUF885 family protein [Brevundimonas sp. A19_0]MBO9501029.1 DUF885 family protein [Brevundimonas sp. A19_0]